MTGDIIEAVLSFWFVEGTVPGLCEYRPIWIASSPEFDAAIETRFSDTFVRAAAEELDNLATTPEGTLAIIIILDQFPRNLFRNSPRAFATDAKARTLCHQAVARGADKKLTGIQRIFCYLPLQHSEEIENATDRWKALIKKRLVIQAREAEAKSELMGLINAENLTRLQDGSIKCRCQGWLIELKPVEEKLTATRLSE